jgi:hypothetical protein
MITAKIGNRINYQILPKTNGILVKAEDSAIGLWKNGYIMESPEMRLNIQL